MPPSLNYSEEDDISDLQVTFRAIKRLRQQQLEDFEEAIETHREQLDQPSKDAVFQRLVCKVAALECTRNDWKTLGIALFGSKKWPSLTVSFGHVFLLR
jgi:hypothetical protein